MKKSVFTFVAAAALAVFTGCSSETSNKKFVMGFDDAFPPMGFRNEKNELVGYDIDLAREVCKRLDMELVLQPIDWNAKEMELNTKKIDCIWNGFTMTPERKEAMTFTPPYLKNAQVFVVAQKSGITSATGLAGMKVGTQAGSSGAEAVAASEYKASFAEIVEFKDYLTALMDLEKGGIAAVAMDSIVARDNINRSGKPFSVLPEMLAAEEYGIGFRKGNTELMEKVWGALDAMAKDGTIAEISKKWFGEDISVVGK